MKSETKKAIKRCDNLWSEIIKKRAGYKSEISGTPGKQIGGSKILNAHHIGRKPNHYLRYAICSGICLTAWEHKYGIHGNFEEDYREKIKAVRGKDIYSELRKLRHLNSPSIFEIEDRLKEELKCEK